MLRIISSKLVKVNQSWLDDIQDVDWFDDEPEFGLGRRPEDVPEEGTIDESNYEHFLADDLDQESQEDSVIDEPAPGSDFLEELPIGNEELLQNPESKEVPYQNPVDLVMDGIANQEVISFEYINRHGAYAGWRTVEPHYTFPAITTGNTVLVSWDRGVNDIRAFIVGRGGQPFVNKKTDPSAGIQSGGVRYENETFELRPEILVK